ncbi:hypothetical protein [Oceanobacillus alkalisoli]|uniref:hypothetical protein n=1 Tax=Oceanobacillus alkalisoli TaxID=2925113 RepID=UPI001F11DBC8|nr:hypothetical protein [Oceanobacillus alkalisoli]MCF3943912.1 hypothetical protein [Oceanobacillus alkalisoli]
MEAIGSVLKKSIPFKEHHEKECEQCGSLYKLYETPKGIAGACKHCMDQQLLEELSVPTKEERERLKEKRFIATFERVTHDLKQATVDSYIPKETSQFEAKKAVLGWAGIVIDAGFNIKDNIQEGESTQRIVGDATVDVVAGIGTMAVAGAATAAVVGTVGLPLLAGAGVGLVAS